MIGAAVLLLAGLRVSAASALADPQRVEELCPRITFEGEAPRLSQSEKRLVCGDPGMESWRNVPLSQARGFLTGFLQQRGRHFPTFRVSGERLIVDVGPPTRTSAFQTPGLEGIYDASKRRGIVGQLLTPGLLDKAKKALVFELQSRGYACPDIQMSADARTGVVVASVTPGERLLLDHIATAPLRGLDPAVFNRYEAFTLGEPIDVRLLSLTSQRIQNDALFLSAYYEIVCSSGSAEVVQRVIEAPPHLVTLGIGADTEGLLIGKASLRNARIGYRASSFEADLYASKLRQSLDAFMRYYFRPADRVHLRPEVFLRRDDEIPYEVAHSQASLGPSWTDNEGPLSLEVRGGPAVDLFKTLRGLGPSNSAWLGFVTHAEVRTHLYEYYATEPRTGWLLSLDTASRIQGVYSAVSEERLRLSGERLWNLGNYDPPLAILATRGWIGTAWSNAAEGEVFLRLPPEDRFFLGGDADMRGAPPMGLPNDAGGFLTGVYDGMELRAGDVLPFMLQPFVFIDAAMASRRAFKLNRPVYYAPGLGLRWASPLGSIRATAARGLVWQRGPALERFPPRWQYFFSFGREF